MDPFDLISSLLHHTEYAKVDSMKSIYSTLIREPEGKHGESVGEIDEGYIHMLFFALNFTSDQILELAKGIATIHVSKHAFQKHRFIFFLD